MNVPEGITEIDEYAFYNCTGITEVHLPESLTKIGYSAFACCQMTGTVTFPAGLTSLGGYAFFYCDKVEYFDLRLCNNSLLTAIGTAAFDGATGRFKVKTGTGIKELLTASGVDAGKIDEE